MEYRQPAIVVHHSLDSVSPYFTNRPTSICLDPQQSTSHETHKQQRPKLAALCRKRHPEPTVTSLQAQLLDHPHHETGDLLWLQLDRIEQHLNQQIEHCVLPLLIQPLSTPPPVATAAHPTKSARSPVAICAVYNPTVYARHLHRAYLQRFLTAAPGVIFVGMNPGPWGMCQTGVPFGSVSIVSDWMRLTAIASDGNHDEEPSTLKPTAIYMIDPVAASSLPPVSGLLCHRTEVSGQQFWTLMRSMYGDEPAAFSRQCFVHNLCPLAFFGSRGRNVTPPELRVS